MAAHLFPARLAAAPPGRGSPRPDLPSLRGFERSGGHPQLRGRPGHPPQCLCAHLEKQARTRAAERRRQGNTATLIWQHGQLRHARAFRRGEKMPRRVLKTWTKTQLPGGRGGRGGGRRGRKRAVAKCVCTTAQASLERAHTFQSLFRLDVKAGASCFRKERDADVGT